MNKKESSKWIDFLTSIGKLSFIGDAILLKNVVDSVCQEGDPGNPFCRGAPSSPFDPNHYD
ncbi:MAG: hypothetical protein PHC94_11915 [Methylobacter sp.]|nr:hypothetical protein [Methylobacter sp.]